MCFDGVGPLWQLSSPYETHRSTAISLKALQSTTAPNHRSSHGASILYSHSFFSLPEKIISYSAAVSFFILRDWKQANNCSQIYIIEDGLEYVLNVPLTTQLRREQKAAILTCGLRVNTGVIAKTDKGTVLLLLWSEVKRWHLASFDCNLVKYSRQ